MLRAQYMARGDAPTLGGLGTVLTVGSLNVLPAEEAGIDRPGTRPDHRQSSPQNCQNTGNQWVANTRQEDPEFDNRDQRPYDWSPQADEYE